LYQWLRMKIKDLDFISNMFLALDFEKYPEHGDDL
jgi:hypothetical protein